MKKIILSIFSLMAISVITSAQSQKGFYLLPTLEFGLSGNHQEHLPNYKLHNAQKQVVKADVGYMFNKHVGIFTGLGLGLYGASYRSLDNFWFMDQHLVQIENPFYVRYTTSLKQRVNFFGNIGIQMSYKIKGSTSELSRGGDVGWNNDNDDIYNTVNVSPFVNAGITLKTRNDSWFDFGAFFDYALASTYGGNFVVMGDTYQAKMWVAGVKFAYGFRLSKHRAQFGGDLQ